MKEESRLVTTLEKFFWVFLFVNPFLDIISGLYIYYIRGIYILDVETISTLGLTPSLVVRMLMLAVFAAYVLLSRDRHAIMTAIPIALSVVLSIGSEYLFAGKAEVFLDLQYAARFAYNIALLLVYTRVFSRRWGTDGKEMLHALDNIAAFTLLVLSLAILVPAMLGEGYSAYADRWGYRGSRGYFYAGNDITAVLAALLPLVVARLMLMDRREHKARAVFFALASGLGGNSLLIIGSKTAFLAEMFTYGLLLLYAVFALLRKEKNSALGYIWALVAMLGVFGLLALMDDTLWDDIMLSLGITQVLWEGEGVETAVFSGRLVKLADQLPQYRSGGVLVWLFGMGRGSQAVILEMDVLEVWLYYGVFGAVTFLWLYAKAAVDFFKGLIHRRFDAMCVALIASIGMVAGYLVIAGHVLFSVTSGFYFIFAIAYSRAYFAHESGDAALWREGENLLGLRKKDPKTP